MTTRLLLVLACTFMPSLVTAQVVSLAMAERAGLSRAWFAVASQDAPTHGVAGAVVHDGTVYVLGGSGLLTAYDAEAGFVRWSTRCGQPGQPLLGPSVHDIMTRDGAVSGVHCGLISGTDLHVIDAATGEFVMSRPLAGAAGGPPAVTSTHVFVPQARGVMIGYPFDRLTGLQKRVASPGRLTAAPTLAGERVIWSTDRGELYGASSLTGRAAYQFNTEAPVAGSPSSAGELISFANREGIVFGLEPEQGRVKWRKALGASIDKAAVAVGDLVLVADQTPTLHALNLETGNELWRVEGLNEFVAASATRVYAVNGEGALGVLDRTTGRPVASWPGQGGLRPVINHETDRLFLISQSGVLHCFHETGSDLPYRHDGVAAVPPIPEEIPAAPGAEAEASTPVAPAAAQPAEEDPFGGSDDPFGAGEPADTPAEEEEDPFGSEDPFGGGEDPFGF